MFYLKVTFLLGSFGLLGFGYHEHELKIVNGETAIPNSLPYQVYLKFEDSIEQWNCGGSLISQNYVLTAGYCTLERDGVNKTVTIYLGAHDISLPKEENRIEMVSTEIITHESLKNRQRGTGNIGIVKLPKSVSFTQAIQSITLGSRAHAGDDVVYKLAEISGWGSTDMMYYTEPSVLHVGEVTLIAFKTCVDIPVYDKNTMLCGTRTRNFGICDNDIGGPLVVDDVQIGIIFYSDPICDINSPQMFINVSAYYDWIEGHSDVIINSSAPRILS